MSITKGISMKGSIRAAKISKKAIQIPKTLSKYLILIFTDRFTDSKTEYPSMRDGKSIDSRPVLTANQISRRLKAIGLVKFDGPALIIAMVRN
jgi:hypothetical protein